jgi:hypothetical protein
MADDPEFLWRLARRCRELKSRTTITSVREHLDLMAAELEARAEAVDGEMQDTAAKAPSERQPVARSRLGRQSSGA